MLAKRFDRLILGGTTFLGDLREELPKDLKGKVAGDVASDLTNTPEQDLPAHPRGVTHQPCSRIDGRISSRDCGVIPRSEKPGASSEATLSTSISST